MSKTTSQAISLSVQDGQPSIELNLARDTNEKWRSGSLLIISNEQKAALGFCFLLFE
jgi:hypothetical protein